MSERMRRRGNRGVRGDGKRDGYKGENFPSSKSDVQADVSPRGYLVCIVMHSEPSGLRSHSFMGRRPWKSLALSTCPSVEQGQKHLPFLLCKDSGAING